MRLGRREEILHIVDKPTGIAPDKSPSKRSTHRRRSGDLRLVETVDAGETPVGEELSPKELKKIASLEEKLEAGKKKLEAGKKKLEEINARIAELEDEEREKAEEKRAELQESLDQTFTTLENQDLDEEARKFKKENIVNIRSAELLDTRGGPEVLKAAIEKRRREEIANIPAIKWERRRLEEMLVSNPMMSMSFEQKLKTLSSSPIDFFSRTTNNEYYKREQAGNQTVQEIIAQIKQINAKYDKILEELKTNN